MEKVRDVTAHDWKARSSHDCKVASSVVELVQTHAEGWRVDHDACDSCGAHTTVCHDAERVFACLLCGRHGQLDPPADVVYQ